MKKLSKFKILILTLLLASCSNNEIKIIHTDAAPEPIGPYSQAVIHDNTLYCSGQVGIDPSTGELVPGGTVEQATQAMNNLKTIIEFAGSNMDKVLKSTIYLVEIKDFNSVNEKYATYFSKGHFPSRVVVEVSDLPKGALVEIEAICAL